MKYVFITNPVSGRQSTKLIDRIEEAFIEKNKGDQFICEYTRKKGHGSEIAAEYSAKYGGDCVIVACGGDGTVHEISGVLVHTDTPMIILPFGTGNDFSKKLYGRNPDPVKVAKLLGFLDGSPKFICRKVDVGQVDDGYFIGVMSFGFDTLVEIAGSKISKKLPFLGSFSYKLGLVMSLFGKKDFDFHLELDGIAEDGSAVKLDKDICFTLMAVCNSSYYGGGYCPAPMANISDGIFELCIAESCNTLDVIKLAPYYTKGTAAQKSRKITLSSVTAGKITAVDGSEFTRNCDGENTRVTSVSFGICHKALRLCIPCPDGAMAAEMAVGAAAK